MQVNIYVQLAASMINKIMHFKRDIRASEEYFAKKVANYTESC